MELEFDIQLHEALEREGETLLHSLPATKHQVVRDLLGAEEAVRSIEHLRVPPGFAGQIAAQIAETALIESLQALPRLEAPVGFAFELAHAIALQAGSEASSAKSTTMPPTPDKPSLIGPELLSARSLSTTAGLNAFSETSSALSGPKLHEQVDEPSNALERALESASREDQETQDEADESSDAWLREAFKKTSIFTPRAPAGFADQIAQMIAADAQLHTTQELKAVQLETEQRSEAVGTSRGSQTIQIEAIDPASFRRPAITITLPAPPEERRSSTRYLLGATMAVALLGVLALAWPYTKLAAETTLEVMRGLSPWLFATYIVALLLTVVAASGRVRMGLVASLAAFGLGSAVVLPQVVPMFGSSRVADITGNVIRIGGDLAVTGHVKGNAISLGGSVRLAPGARVDGRVITVLGDINIASGAVVSGEAAAVLGAYRSGTQTVHESLSTNLPGVVANVIKPLRSVVQTRYWPILYIGLIGVAAALLLMLPGWAAATHREFRLHPGRALGLGLAVLFLGVPLALLSAPTLIGMPFALTLGLGIALLFTVGLGLSALELGRGIGRLLNLRMDPMLEVSAGLGLFLIAVPFPPLAITLWVLGGSWGAGTLLIAWRSGRLPIHGLFTKTNPGQLSHAWGNAGD